MNLISGLERPLEAGMATHSSILAWRIPWTEEPGGPQSIGSQRVGPRWKQLSTRVHMHTRAMVKIRDVKARLPVFKREPRVHP